MASKIRYIILDTTDEGGFGIHKTQMDWFVNTLLSTEENYKIVVLSHCPIGRQGMMQHGAGYFYPIYKILNAYQDKTTVTLTSSDECDMEEGETQRIYDLSGAKTKIFMNLCGHGHMDWQSYYNGIVYIMTSCDANYSYSPERCPFNQHTDRTTGTVNEQSFDSILFDGEVINCIKIGAGDNRKINVNAYKLSVGGNIQLETTLQGDITWGSYDYAGLKEIQGRFEVDNTFVNVVNGNVSAIASGTSVVIAYDSDFNKEFFFIDISE